jgi:hypothetical protein
MTGNELREELERLDILNQEAAGRLLISKRQLQRWLALGRKKIPPRAEAVVMARLSPGELPSLTVRANKERSRIPRW